MSAQNSSAPPLRAVGYRRVSMRDQVDGFSLDAQENNIARYVEEHDWQLIEVVHGCWYFSQERQPASCLRADDAGCPEP